MTRNRMLIYATIALVLVGAAFYKLDLQPQRDTIASKEQELAASQTALAAARVEIAAGQAAKEGRNDDAAEVLRVGRAAPDDLDQPSLVYQLNAAARASGIAFVSVSVGGDGAPAGSDAGTGTALPPGAVAGAAGFAAQPLELEFRGTYFELTGFTRRIRDFVEVANKRLDVRGRLIVPNVISMELAESGFPAITAKITATTYLLPAGAAPVADATTPTPGTPATTTTATAPATAGGTPATTTDR